MGGKIRRSLGEGESKRSGRSGGFSPKWVPPTTKDCVHVIARGLGQWESTSLISRAGTGHVRQRTLPLHLTNVSSILSLPLSPRNLPFSSSHIHPPDPSLSHLLNLLICNSDKYSSRTVI